MSTLFPDPEGLDDFRVFDPYEVHALLRQMAEQRVLVTIATADGISYTTTLWEVDKAQGVVRFDADSRDPQIDRLLDAEDAVAVSYLDDIKIQFDVAGLVHVHAGDGASALNCRYPHELYRFQRRHAYRVQPLRNATPHVRLRHPAAVDGELTLRVIDVSITGIALFQPAGQPALEPGLQIDGVVIGLDAQTQLKAMLRVVHVTSMNGQAAGVRVGCEIENMDGESLRTLQRYIDQTQKRRRMMSADGA
ncbi:flagellar brake protein [Caldimonas thermodepolymerans]|uniref:flagellar brake protein n=1 Tax=Caldimonas thermodepolymerans TaxID=215580 RepID=UPI002235AEFE|nr:flagellar brake protein [Caldimonas thermodepolymerans]UZG43520.1 flagellar brake protein [Caldimonas thermodepolymerans]